MRAIVTVFAALAIAAGATAAVPARPARCLVLLTPAISVHDLDPATMPSVRWLVNHAAIGLMNTRVSAGRRQLPRLDQVPTTRSLTPDPVRGGAYMTLGAGTRCYGGQLAGEALQRHERSWEGSAEQEYALRNQAPPPPGELLQPNAYALLAANQGLGYRARPGSLAELLSAAGVATAAIGSADRPGDRLRDVALAAMGPNGAVAYGKLSGVCVRDPREPFGRRDDVGALLAAVRGALSVKPGEAGRVVFLDWGDAARLDDYVPAMTAHAQAAAKLRMLHRLDALLRGLLLPTRNGEGPMLDLSRDRLVWLSPYPPRLARAAMDTLAPVFVAGPGFEPGRFLTSPTTRRKGIIANTDIAPTVAAWYGAGRDPTMVGRPFTAVRVSVGKGDTPFGRLISYYARLSASELQRRSTMPYVLRLMQVVTACLALMWLVGRTAGWRRYALPVALLPIAAPTAAIALDPLSFGSVVAYQVCFTALMLALAVAAALLSWRGANPVMGPAALCGLLVALVVVDGVRGFRWMPLSTFGYSIMDGSRYYGIGNEAMGPLITAALVVGGALAAAWGKRGARVAIAVFLVVTAVLIAPAWGAKFGGALTAGMGFALAAMWAYGHRVRGRTVAVAVLCAAGAVAAMVMLDVARGGSGSHVGMLYRAIREGGPMELALVAQRKFGMNMRLLAFSPWSRLLGLCVLAASAFWYDGWRRRQHKPWPDDAVGYSLKAALVAAAVAFGVDDAGVLAAAAALAMVPPVLFAVEETERRRAT